MKINYLITNILVLGFISLGAQRGLAETQAFLDARLEGRHIDRCIQSHRYPQPCTSNATKEVANNFCKKMGYQYATQWSWRDKDWKYREVVWVYTEEWQDGQIWNGWKLREGGFMFEAIICSR